MAKDVFTTYSDDNMYGATCIVDLEPDYDGRYYYRVIHTSAGTFGSAKSLKEAIRRAENAAREHFKYEGAKEKLLKLMDLLKYV